MLIVDDHELFRASARALLESEGFVIVGEAASGVEALVAAAALQPEIVLLDIQLPDMDGRVVAARLAATEDARYVVLISSREAASYGPKLSQCQAHGFIAKSALSGDAIMALVG